jgi:hypothetical protein
MQKLSTTHPLHVDPKHADALPSSVGVEREEWYAEARRSGDRVTVTMTAADPHRALAHLVTSEDPIDRWFKDEVQKLTDVSLAAVFSHVRTPRLIRH